MGQNAKLFQQFINENTIPMVTNNNIEGFTTFVIPEEQAIKSAKVKVVVAITDDDAYADMYIYDIANVINDDTVKAKLYKLLNDLNSSYKFISFYEIDNIINAKCCIPFSNNFDAQLVFNILSVLSSAVEDEYDNIMKTLWDK
ncbi:hypothetical protein LGL55_20580 [Clostridium tagluense]|uniref:hypothetical protein n=1 Tax=Clostridium TaxID=1485 RepID=UPI0013E97506|nr:MULTISPECIES: hypothetical protein [Clostridium]MBU3127066.1 hypothetical protein [Clostridium tagluense]MBZ9625273.1 hypothetical protein [Clostridium sp. FP2]MCB2311067.1 hypothetical protein [Clostridium tagluense]MCB2318344.1 hypothetical protein [Clostridium tagluense]MCB2323182.1 hypothetical protein [Clostridium tagluense]